MGEFAETDARLAGMHGYAPAQTERERSLAQFVGRLEAVLVEMRDQPEVNAAASAGFELWWCAEAFAEARQIAGPLPAPDPADA